MINPHEHATASPLVEAIAFYNLENLFDIQDNLNTNDNDFLPESRKQWTAKRYRKKVKKLSFAISNIGEKETGKCPAIVGLAEVENTKVITDLMTSDALKNTPYACVHYDSPDERGIDVGLLYDQRIFSVTQSEPISVTLKNRDNSPDYTRDILWVSGILDGMPLHIIVNHWPSRYGGTKKTAFKRIAVAHKVGEIIGRIRKQDPEAKLIVMGDFNDNPQSESVQFLTNKYDLWNPMKTLGGYHRGSVRYGQQWYLYDQILMSNNFLAPSSKTFEFSKADIFDENFLKHFKGRFKGSPFRTYLGKKYKGGYSDHFPVYCILKK